MSMRDYGVDVYGIEFNSNHLQCMAARICDDYSDDDWDSDEKYYYIDELMDKLDLRMISEFTGDTICVDEYGNDDCGRGVNVYDSDTIYYIELYNKPGLYNKPYDSIDDIISELKSRIGGYLPQNFTYEKELRHIVGTYYG